MDSMKGRFLSGCGSLVVVAVLIIAFCTFSSAESVGKTAEENLILFYDGDTVPAGWTCISDNLGEPFYQIFPRGSGTYGGTGGSLTHTHTVSFVSCSGPSDLVRACPFDLYAFPTSTHTHGLFDADISYKSNLPEYKNLKVIKYNNGVPTTIPAGAISIFDTAPPAGWTRYSAQDNYFVRGVPLLPQVARIPTITLLRSPPTDNRLRNSPAISLDPSSHILPPPFMAIVGKAQQPKPTTNLLISRWSLPGQIAIRPFRKA